MIRLIFVIGYIWGVGELPDIRRVFSYHGAEHKTINAFEDSAVLSCSSIKPYSLYHPRCGTGFVVILVVFLPNIWIRLLTRIVLIPILVMIAYEYMRFSAINIKHPVFRFLSVINMGMQRLTTVEPTDEMLEVSLTAFETMYKLEMGKVDG